MSVSTHLTPACAHPELLVLYIYIYFKIDKLLHSTYEESFPSCRRFAFAARGARLHLERAPAARGARETPVTGEEENCV
jgi:hypothetical protein